MNTFQLDRLPVELFHHLLGYFSAHEIFYTFTNITLYIDSVLFSYTNYRVNFKETSRAGFDLFCRHVIPDRVVALTLTDDEDTPGLIDLFCSRFRIDLFARLQALRLSGIGPDFIKRAVGQMIDLKYLQSLRYLSINSDNLCIRNMFEENKDHAAQLDQYLFSTNHLVSPRQHSLKSDNDEFVTPVIFARLRHLALKETSINLIKNIALVVPKLRTLKTCLLLDRSHTETMPPLPKLNRLILRLEGEKIPAMKHSYSFELFRLLCYNEHTGTDDVQSSASSTSSIDFIL